jgi:SOS response regulatory protein OraA/RecX
MRTMKIKLKTKTKATHIVSVDEEIWGILPAKILRFFSLHPDIENDLPETENNKILMEIEKYSWDRLLNFITYRERSTWECKNFLKLLPLKSDLIEKLLAKAIELDFVKDERFAEMLVSDLLQKGKSRQEIKNKLYEKRVNSEIIENTLNEQFSSDVEDDLLNINLDRAIRKYFSLPSQKRKEKILNYLTRKGFSYWQVKEKMEEKEI